MIEWFMQFMIVTAVLLLCIIMAIIRVVVGPTAADRVVGVDTINTIIIVAMVLFGAAYQEVIYIDVAIVYAFLSFIATLFIAKYVEGGEF